MRDLPSGSVEIAYAVTEDVVVVGSGPAFVKRVLDSDAGDVARPTDRYKSLARPGRRREPAAASSTSPPSAS